MRGELRLSKRHKFFGGNLLGNQQVHQRFNKDVVQLFLGGKMICVVLILCFPRILRNTSKQVKVFWIPKTQRLAEHFLTSSGSFLLGDIVTYC